MSNIPKLRFPEFTDAWEKCKLESLGKILTGNTPKTKEKENWTIEGEGYIWITPTDIDGLLTSKSARSLTETGWKKSRQLPPNSVLITSIASIGKNTINTVPAAFNQQINAIIPENNDAYFILSAMVNCEQDFAELAGQTAVPIINKTTFSEFEIFTPTLPEQQKIGALFRRLDRLITLHKRKWDDVILLKKALLQKMFPKNGSDFPALRFPEFTDAWEKCKLGDVAERVTRKNKNLESDLPLTISAQDGLISQNEFFNKQIASRDISGYYLLQKGEFAYNKSYSNGYPWGAIKRLEKYENGVVSTLYICFALNEKANSDFISTYYDTNIWHSEVSQISAEGARNHGLLNIAANDFFKTLISLPTLPEQQKIGTLFRRLDRLITLHKRQHEHYQLLKKALLQQMFV